jgi:biotin carboxyl carrier protein
MPAKASRRLLIFSPDTSQFAVLPPFLRQLQALTSIDQLVAVLGGVDIDRLKVENTQLRARIVEITAEMERLKKTEPQVPVDSCRLNILESSGRAHDLKNVSIKYPEGHGPADERRGIRVRNGTAESLLKWSDVSSLELRPLKQTVDVVMPEMGESITEGTVTKWIRNVGDHVKWDEPMFEISTDKVDAEVPSPATGTIIEILVSEGRTVPINAIVARIAEEQRDQSATAKHSYIVGATLCTGRTLWLTLANDSNMEAGGTGLLFGMNELGETTIRFANIHKINPAPLPAAS